jgi:hypothetical protein
MEGVMNRQDLRQMNSLGMLKVFVASMSMAAFLSLPTSLSAQSCPNPQYGGCSSGCDIVQVWSGCGGIPCETEMVCYETQYVVMTGDYFCFDACGWVTDWYCGCWA